MPSDEGCDTGDELAVEVSGLRKGRALHVKIVASALGRVAGSDFEQPRHWLLDAKGDGTSLDRLVNGSTRVTRLQTDGLTNRWDVTVKFDTAFRLPQELTSSEIWVAPPGGEPERFLIAGL